MGNTELNNLFLTRNKQMKSQYKKAPLTLLKAEVEKLLANDKIIEAIHLIRNEIDNQDIKNEVISLERRLNENKKNFHKGLLNQEDLSIENNKLLYAILHIFSDLMGEVKTFGCPSKELLKSRLSEISFQERYNKKQHSFYNTKENVQLFKDMVKKVIDKLENDIIELNKEYPNRIRFQKQEIPQRYILINFGKKSIYFEWASKSLDSLKGAYLLISLLDRNVSPIDITFSFPSGNPIEISRRIYHPTIDEQFNPSWEIIKEDENHRILDDDNSIVEYVLDKITEYI